MGCEMTHTHYAVYANYVIYGIGTTPESALADAASNDCTSERGLVPHDPGNWYDGGIVDMTHCRRLTGDGEAALGCDAKLRRCTAELAAAVAAGGGDLLFQVAADGTLELTPAE